ncbi:MAG TPA: sigma-70 family RNA polymerase sigma factor [Anaeromyxobacteraceae bacterium]|nr:sigma-70 family RNA polymerase sigma factor [Anaeromyxobacteraceae bacterium]
MNRPGPAESRALERYLREIRRYPLLSADEERELARTCRAALVTGSLRFVVRIARQYRARGARLADLVQEGNLGLLRAVEKFDPDRGVRLASYAAWWIRAYIQSAVARSHALARFGTTLPRRQRSTARLAARDASFDAPEGEGGEARQQHLTSDSPPQDVLVAEREEQRLMEAHVSRALVALRQRERYIIEHRVMSETPETLEEVGHCLGVTRERVRQLELRAKRKLTIALGELAAQLEWPARGQHPPLGAA